MRITDIRAIQPPTPGSPPDWRTQLGQIVVEVSTDSGLRGIGVGGGGAASVHVIHSVLRDLLVGRDAREVEELHAAMYRHTLFYGRKGLVIMALSGVDLALWDLRGKAAGAPVARLLEPRADLSKPLPAYATVEDGDGARAALARGYKAIKLHVDGFGDRPDPAAISDLAGRVREMLGSGAPLMIDAFGRWDVESTLCVAEAIAPQDVSWIEEPLPPDDTDGYRAVATRSPVPIAGGEHEYTARGFRELIDRRLHAVLQPDISWCGGMTTLVEVYRMASEAGLRVCPHRGSEPFAIHAIAALDTEPLAESPRPWFRCLRGAPGIERGEVRLNEAPGFGVELEVENG